MCNFCSPYFCDARKLAMYGKLALPNGKELITDAFADGSSVLQAYRESITKSVNICKFVQPWDFIFHN